MLGVSGIDAQLLQHPTLSLALPNYCQVLEEAARQSGCDNFGLYYGQQFKPQALGLLGYIGLCSATVEQALINFARAFPLHQRNSLIRLVDDGDCYRFDYQVRHGAILWRRQDAELTLGMARNLIRHVLGSQWAPRAVHFEHPRPADWHEHSKVFDAPVYFEQPYNSLLIPKVGLNRAMPDSDPMLLMVMQDSLRQLSLAGRDEPDVVDDARAHIRQRLVLGEPGLEDISIEALDNAYIRRFDLVLELPNPPRKQRERIIRDASGDRLGQALVKKLVEHEEMTPAVVTRAVQIGRGLHPRSSRALDATVETLVSATLKAQGFVTLDQSAQPALPEFYSPGLVNTDLPLEGLLGGLRQNPEARLCFYGPPGTGKTAFGHWLAQQLEKPLMVKRVSDLVAPFVGETEQNLARAFAAAQLEDAVLLFDEVDSFLQDRKKARQSWEITAVNEMLTQMESYQGLFIASTNLMQDLDEASIRRFDLKIHFDYLKPQQIRDLFTSHLKAMKLKDPAGSAVNQLLGEGALTPGDFALVARRARFQPFATAQQMAVALIQEVRLKRQTQRPIGFVH